MDDLNRRRFLFAAAGSAALIGLSRCAIGASGQTAAQVARPVPPSAIGPPPLLPPPPAELRLPLRPGVLSGVPGSDVFALTVDDGVDTEVVRLYTQFAKESGVRLTYFVNGVYSSWTDNAALLRPLVESGQIQLGNHTWSHPDLTTLPKQQIADQLIRNDAFLKDTFGVTGCPYFRPPYGNHNADVDSVAADLGYTVPTLWSGSLEDQVPIAEDTIVQMADRYFTPQTVVIGHLNHSPVTHVFSRLVDIIRARNLRTVTLNDVYLRPEVSGLTSPYPS